jgi:hypothetical protein
MQVAVNETPRALHTIRFISMSQSIRETVTVTVIGSPFLRMRNYLRSPTSPDNA